MGGMSETRKNIFAAAFLSSTLVCGAASAADIGLPAHESVAIVARPIWTGCYFGANGGWLEVRNDSTFGPPAFAGSPPLGASLGGHNANGWLAGVQIGCNYQLGNWVFGAQGGFDWSDAKGSHSDPFLVPTTDSSRTRQLMEMTWRVGYSWGRFLGYVKAGGGWERIDYTILILPTTSNAAYSSRETGGWTVGLGGEYAITDWLSAFLEYRYLDFGTCTNSFVDGFGTFIGNVRIRDTKESREGGPEPKIRRLGRRHRFI
jgi:outer membrane immunogenic protein